MTEQEGRRPDKAIEMIREEYEKAISEHEPFHSAHEGYGVIKEEFDELWEEIRKKESAQSKEAMAEEAIHTCVTLLRFLVEVCKVDHPEDPKVCSSCGKELDATFQGDICPDCYGLD